MAEEKSAGVVSATYSASRSSVCWTTSVLRGNLAGVQDIVRTVLKRDDIEVIEAQTQDELSNLVGHGVRLDILAKDANGNSATSKSSVRTVGPPPQEGR